MGSVIGPGAGTGAAPGAGARPGALTGAEARGGSNVAATGTDPGGPPPKPSLSECRCRRRSAERGRR